MYGQGTGMYRYHEVDVENGPDVLFALTPAEAEVSVSPVFAEEEL